MAKKKGMTKKFQREFFRKVTELDKFIKDTYPEADYFSIGRVIGADGVNFFLTQTSEEAPDPKGEYTISQHIWSSEVK